MPPQNATIRARGGSGTGREHARGTDGSGAGSAGGCARPLTRTAEPVLGLADGKSRGPSRPLPPGEVARVIPPGVPGQRCWHCQRARERDAGDQLFFSFRMPVARRPRAASSRPDRPRSTALVPRPIGRTGASSGHSHGPVVVRDGRSSRELAGASPFGGATTLLQPSGRPSRKTTVGLAPQAPPPLRQPVPVITAAPSVKRSGRTLGLKANPCQGLFSRISVAGHAHI